LSEKLPSHNRSIRQNPQGFRAALVTGLGQFRRFTKQLSDADVPLLVGTDTEIFGTAGASAHEELTEMVSAGLTPYQALLAGTRRAGEFVASRVRKTEQFGTVAVGQRADLLVLSANPLVSVENTNRIEGVLVRGRWLPASRLAAMRDSLALIRARQNPLVARFDSLMTAGKLDEAEKALNELRRVNAASAPIAQVVLWVKAQRALQRDTLAALRILQWEAEMFPESHSSHAELARVYALRNDTAHAVAEARRALAIYPKHEPALRVLGQFGKRD
jgi:tetratricopeptide (TPR) repeat protein